MYLYEMDYLNLQKEILELQKRFPFTEIEIIGKSHAGRNIYLLKFGKGNRNILYAASFHGLEFITSSVCLEFFEKLCKKYEKNENYFGFCLKDFYESSCLYFIPRVNPDGSEIYFYGAKGAGKYESFINNFSQKEIKSWQANARGVDINHNFDADFFTLKELENRRGYISPGPTRFGGNFPESENETRAICTLCRKVPFSYVFAFHSQGEEIYYTYKNIYLKDALRMANTLSCESGYTLSVPSDELASLGGFKDWFISFFRRPGFTFEIGKGKNPLPQSSYNDVYLKLEKALVRGLFL